VAKRSYEHAKLLRTNLRRGTLGVLKKDYKVGDQVLLLNSRFKFSLCKLVSKWEGTMVIKDVYIPDLFYSIV
jgi:hypothetical protein